MLLEGGNKTLLSVRNLNYVQLNRCKNCSDRWFSSGMPAFLERSAYLKKFAFTVGLGKLEGWWLRGGRAVCVYVCGCMKLMKLALF